MVVHLKNLTTFHVPFRWLYIWKSRNSRNFGEATKEQERRLFDGTNDETKKNDMEKNTNSNNNSNKKVETAAAASIMWTK